MATLFIGLLVGCQSSRPMVPVSKEVARSKTHAEWASVQPRKAAIALLDSLTGQQHEVILRPIDTELRVDWHYIPRDRQGLKLGDMTAGQKTLTHKLMQTALSDSGYLKATDIIWLESVLYEMSNQNPGRDPGKYVLQIFGDPTDETAAWGWRLEGHHLSINLTYTPEGIGVTPLFFGTNPAVVQQGPLAGKRILADAHNLAIALATSMNDEQRKKMMLDKKPRDVVTGPGREAALSKQEGVKVDEMTSKQQAIMVALFRSHTLNYEAGVAEDMERKLWAETLFLKPDGDLYFAWAGPIDTDKPFYYRIQSKTLVIEYSCQGKNHVHAVIHDLTDPLQEDLLKKHFEQHAHDAE